MGNAEKPWEHKLEFAKLQNESLYIYCEETEVGFLSHLTKYGFPRDQSCNLYIICTDSSVVKHVSYKLKVMSLNLSMVVGRNVGGVWRPPMGIS